MRLILIAFIFTFNYLNAQSDYLYNSIISVSGSSSYSNENLLIQQCIGQQSPIGLSSTSLGEFRQGFIQPIRLKQMIQNQDGPQINISVYPNPASQYINLDIGDDSLRDYSIIICDAKGIVVFSNLYTSSKEIRIPVTSLSSGNYYLIITNSEEQKSVTQIAVSH